MELIKLNTFDNNKKNILIYFGLSLLSPKCRHVLIRLIRHLELVKKDFNLIVLSCYKSKKIFKMLDKYVGPDAFVKFDFQKLMNSKTWKEVRDKIKKEGQAIEIEFTLSLLIGTHSDRFTKDVFKRHLFHENSNISLNYMIVARDTIPAIVFCHFSNRSKNHIYHYVLDPRGLDFDVSEIKRLIEDCKSYTRFFGYTSKDRNLVFSSLVHYETFFHYRKKFRAEEKKYNFVFGYAVLDEDRRRNMIDTGLNQLMNELEVDDTNQIFVQDQFLNINNFLDFSDYAKYLSRARYTLIIPSCDINHISIYRIVESIALNVVPLFTRDNNFSILKENNIMKDYLSELIIKDFDDLKKKIKDRDFYYKMDELLQNEFAKYKDIKIYEREISKYYMNL